jgi:hypothetical protein
MKTKYLIIISTLLIVLTTGQKLLAMDHQMFTEILKNYVKNGLADYKNLKNDKQLDKYLSELSNTNPDKLNRNEKLAFWINAYNAFTLKLVVDNYPLKSITDIKTSSDKVRTVWDTEFITINNKKYSLNYIEHKILRKMNEPRIHFAIVCASISCPELIIEAFEADKIELQLENRTKIFLNDKSRNHFDMKNRKAHISEIFNWFEKDFGKNDKEVLTYFSQYLPDNIKTDINQNIDKWKIDYNDYNWNLNEITIKE